MLTSVIEWHDASVELPTGSCEVIGKTAHGMYLMPFSSRYKLFNMRDHYTEDDIPKYAFTNGEVLYWAHTPVFPENESEGV
jgi:hypothetical protein